MAKRVSGAVVPVHPGTLWQIVHRYALSIYMACRNKNAKPLNSSFCGLTVTLPFSLAQPLKVEARRGRVSAVLESDHTLSMRGVQGLLRQHIRTTGATNFSSVHFSVPSPSLMRFISCHPQQLILEPRIAARENRSLSTALALLKMRSASVSAA